MSRLTDTQLRQREQQHFYLKTLQKPDSADFSERSTHNERGSREHLKDASYLFPSAFYGEAAFYHAPSISYDGDPLISSTAHERRTAIASGQQLHYESFCYRPGSDHLSVYLSDHSATVGGPTNDSRNRPVIYDNPQFSYVNLPNTNQ